MSRLTSNIWLRFATVAAVAVAFASCQHGLEEMDEAPVRMERIKLSIAPSQEGIVSEPETKTELVNSRILWLPADEIAVFSAGEKARFVSMNTIRTGSTTFTGTVTVPTAAEGNDAYVWALYPYNADASYDDGKITSTLPSLQVGAKGTFGDDLLPMMGRSLNPFIEEGQEIDFGVSTGGVGTSFYDIDPGDEGWEIPTDPGTPSAQAIRMTFSVISSGFRFTVSRSDIKSITMTATGGEAIAGTFTARFNDSGVPEVVGVTNASSSVTITAPDGGTFEPGVSYYMVLLPTRLSQGATFTFSTGSMTGTRVVSSAFSLVRSKFTWKESLDSKAVFTVNPDATSSGQFVYASHSVKYDEDFRAVWVATVKNIDFPTTSGASAQKAELVELFTDMKRMGFNAIVFQVNPYADALWDSDLLPWSHFLTGTQGKDPGYDPLQFAVETAHSLGMELHAWFNPYRIGPKSLKRASSHPIFSHKDWYGVYKDNYYWNPGNPDVRTFLGKVMKEVVTKYDVDGTHIDDYFYPSGLRSSTDTWDDSAEYSEYGNGKTLTNWRIYNVDQTVKLYQKVTHQAKANVVFGAAPGGTESYANSLYCYPPHWLKAGTVDYISPQIYWDHKRGDSANFDKVLNIWLGYERSEDCPLMPGLAPYMVYDAGTSFYFYGHPDEMLYQVEDIKGHGLKGSIWFRARYCQKPLLTNYIPENVYTHELLTPQITLSPASLPAPVVGISGMKLSWGEVQGADNYVVLELKRESSSSTVWDATIVSSGAELRSFTGQQGHYYIVIARSGSTRSTYGSVIYLG